MNTTDYPQSSTTPLDSISIEHAEAWTKNWQKLFPNHCKAFLIPIPDVMNLLEELGILKNNKDGTYESLNKPEHKNMGIRAYMALGDMDGDGNLEERLVMVGAIKNNEDIFIDQVADRKDAANVALSGSGAFDFTSPCPNECDPKSSLFHK